MKIRTIGALAGVAALALVFAPGAHAQGGRGMGMMGGGGPLAGLRVLATPEGEKELNITADQKTKLQELNENYRQNMMARFRDLGEEFQNLSPEERMEKSQAVMRELATTTKKDLKEILDEKQLKRFEEINIQAMGFGAFTSPEIVEKLKLTADQKEKIQDVQRELGEAMRDAFQTIQDDREAGRAAMTKAQDSARDKAIALLSSEQKATWKELTGEPFKMPPLQGPGGGRRRID